MGDDGQTPWGGVGVEGPARVPSAGGSGAMAAMRKDTGGRKTWGSTGVLEDVRRVRQEANAWQYRLRPGCHLGLPAQGQLLKVCEMACSPRGCVRRLGGTGTRSTTQQGPPTPLAFHGYPRYTSAMAPHLYNLGCRLWQGRLVCRTRLPCPILALLWVWAHRPGTMPWAKALFQGMHQALPQRVGHLTQPLHRAGCSAQTSTPRAPGASHGPLSCSQQPALAPASPGTCTCGHLRVRSCCPV